MADKRISQLIERTDIANNDVLPIVASAAITTNKVTVSTLQDWMQDNLDLGVTSVGITVGSSGTDINVTGSPITTSGNITINIPTASATNRGLLSAADWTTFNNKQDAGNFVTIDTIQTVTGQKTFNSLRINSSNGIIFSQQGGHGIPEIGNTMTTAIANDYRFIFGLGSGNYKSFSFVSNSLSNNVNRALVVPDASGTIALTSDLGDFVTLSTAQTITATKTFNNSGSASNIIVNHTSGSGIALDITKGGNGEGIRVNKTGGSGNAATIIGTLEATDLVGGSATISGNLAVDTNTLFVDASSNSVGIGTTTTDERLKLSSAGTGASVPAGITLYGNNGSAFGGSNVARSKIDSVTDGSAFGANLRFFTNDTSNVYQERMRITSGGNVTIKAPTASGGGVLNLENTDTAVNGQNWGSLNFISNDSSSGASGIRASLVGTSTSFNGDGNLVFSTAPSNGTNTERMRITSAGNVGIGTTNPSATLDIQRNSPTTYFRANASDSNRPLNITSSTTDNNGDTHTFNVSSISGVLAFATNSIERMRINRDGNVGIGTTSPGSKLEIVDTSDFAIRLLRSGVREMLIGSDGSITANSTEMVISSTFQQEFRTGGSERMRITSTGNVGIGTTNPSEKLDVNGNIKASSFLSDTFTVSVPNNTATTILELGISGFRNTVIRVSVTDVATHIMGVADVFVNWNGATYIVNFTQIHIGLSTSVFTLSGSLLQFRHTFGSTRALTVRYIKL